jgi:predicted transposase/invertase (TIGR01784 family)
VNEKLKESISDILYTVETTEGLGYLSLLLEHQHTPQRMLAFRILRYKVAIMDRHIQQRHAKLPLVYAIVIYNGKVSPYPYSQDIFDLFEDRQTAEELLFNPFHLIAPFI